MDFSFIAITAVQLLRDCSFRTALTPLFALVLMINTPTLALESTASLGAGYTEADHITEVSDCESTPNVTEASDWDSSTSVSLLTTRTSSDLLNLDAEVAAFAWTYWFSQCVYYYGNLVVVHTWHTSSQGMRRCTTIRQGCAGAVVRDLGCTVYGW